MMAKAPLLKTSIKPFLDTSVLIKWYLGTTAYKTYLKATIITPQPYINSFVKMEFMRAVLFLLVNFYEDCKLPYFTSIDDVLKSWSNKFKQREVKMLLQLVPEILQCCAVPSSDKNLQITRLGDFILLLADQVREDMRNCNCELVNCKKGELQFGMGETVDEIINNFRASFTYTELFETHCKVHSVICIDMVAQIKALEAKANNLSDKKSEGFRELVKKVREAQQKGALKCSDCAKIGDFMVALTCPDSHTGQTLDDSFSYLAPVLGKNFTILMSESALRKSGYTPNTTAHTSLPIASPHP